MALTRDFKRTVVDRVQRDPASGSLWTTLRCGGFNAVAKDRKTG